ncbi:MAG: long-chain fatty acid--CoA ligase [Candidatus Schekmanbacteria bacterium]|nr:long-chain fatty acid--CoA ligase [Candidatus Schekmanbacteria bacterium]
MAEYDRNLPQVFLDRVSRMPDRTAFRFKERGAWKDVSWHDAGSIAEEIAAGLIIRGLLPGDKVALLAQTRYEWVLCDLGALMAGAVTVPIYPSNTTAQTAYILGDSDCRFVFCDNRAQLDKVARGHDALPHLQLAVMMAPEAPVAWTTTLEHLREEGGNAPESVRTELRARIAATKPDAHATYVYTSGTTGPPKAVIQTHRNHVAMTTNLARISGITPDDVELIYLPLAHSFARCLEFNHIATGHVLAFAESIDKVIDNLQEVRPTVMGSVPRIFEKAQIAIAENAQAGSPVKARLFQWALSVGLDYRERQREHRPISLALAAQHALADLLVFSQIRALFGGRIRFFVAGGAPLAPDLGRFFHATGLLIREGYGLTETCPATHMNREDAFKFGTVGPAIPGVEVRIADDGEILVRGPNVSQGYLGKPEATAEAFDARGWLHTGDVGELDEEGFLRITDRKKDIIVTSAGKNIAPQNIENLLRAHRLIGQALVYGDQRNYLTALIALDPEGALAFASQKGLGTTDLQELAENDAVREAIGACVHEVNEQLASFESIKKFRILPHGLSEAEGELTPTLKLRRSAVTLKYMDFLDAMYE